MRAALNCGFFKETEKEKGGERERERQRERGRETMAFCHFEEQKHTTSTCKGAEPKHLFLLCVPSHAILKRGEVH